MKVALVLLVLLSGSPYFTFASNRLRVLTTEGKQVFNESLHSCQIKNQSLATLYDDDDVKHVLSIIKENSYISVWLGLKKKTQMTVRWSDGSAVQDTHLDAGVEKGLQICVAMENNTEKAFNCSERKYFMCYNGTTHALIEHEKDWCQALRYCRRYYNDLVSITSEEKKQLAINAGKNNSFWTGLMQDEWGWLDGSCSTFRKWGIFDDKKCTSVYKNHMFLRTHGCTNNVVGLCSKGDVRIKIIEKNLTWEEAFNYCQAEHSRQLRIEDAGDQADVQARLNHSEVNGPFWIGLRQSLVFGFWFWSDAKAVYDNWRDGKAPELPFSNHCGVIHMDGLWSDEDCRLQLPFLCEEDIVSMERNGNLISSIPQTKIYH